VRYILALVVLFTATFTCAAHAQNGLYTPPIEHTSTLDRVLPSVDLSGREAFPMLYIDEGTFDLNTLPEVDYPALAWNQAKACYEQESGEVVDLAGPPTLRVVPAAVRTFRVRDLTVDSLNYADDTTYAGEHFAPPTIGYTLVRSGGILIAERYKNNLPVLRHEALHWIIWHQRKILGHPPEFFVPCDQYYDERHSS